MIVPRIPTDCPRCGKVLYPISRMRPQPRLSIVGMLGFVVAGLVSTAIYFLTFAYIRGGVHIPTTILAPIVVVPALVPGILIGLVVNRLPRVVKLRCARCHWNEKLSVARMPGKSRASAKKVVPTMVEVGSPRVMPAPGEGEQGSYAEIRAWIYAEFVSGRSFDEIFAEMTGGGWNKEEAEALVEEGRKATRDRRP